MRKRKIPKKRKRQKKREIAKNPFETFCTIFEIKNLPQHYRNQKIIDALWDLSKTLEKGQVRNLILCCNKLLSTPEHIKELNEVFKKYFDKETVDWFVVIALPLFNKTKISSAEIGKLILLISNIRKVCQRRKITPTPVLKELANCNNFEEMKKLASKFLQTKSS